MIKDQSDILFPVLALGPVALDADNVPVAVDLNGYEAAMIEIAVGIGGITFTADNKIEFKLTDSEDDGDTDPYAAVTAADVQGVTPATGGIIKSLVAAHAAATVTKIGYIGRKRYLKILADFSGTHGAATPICVTVVKGRARAIAPA